MVSQIFLVEPPTGIALVEPLTDIALVEPPTGIALVEPPTGIAPAVIVVNPPDPKSPLAVGDTFTQMISIVNLEHLDRNTLPLSAWQMDIVFDPLILEFVSVTAGDFLKSDSVNAAFFVKTNPGRISVAQVRTGHSGISLTPGEIGELLTIEFRVLAFGEEVLGIHRVKLQSGEDYDHDGTPDRISYIIVITDVFVATHQSSSAKEDVNEDGVVDIIDISIIASNIGESSPITRVDINGDGIVDVLDLILVTGSPYYGRPVLSSAKEDVNEDGVVDIIDISIIASNIGESSPITRVDINGDGVVDVVDLILVAGSPYFGGPAPIIQQQEREPNTAAPSASVAYLTPDKIKEWIDFARVRSDGSLLFQRGIANLQRLLVFKKPDETRLLLNYPNPFNPETWIPYQLAEAADVTVTIHSINGRLIRTLALGHQAAGLYRSKSRAAYWDGRNEFGEKAASGLYFYTFTAGSFSATGKMLIRK